MSGKQASVLDGVKVVLVAEYGRSGGTRTYLRQLISFYAKHNAELLVVRDGPVLDHEMDGLLRQAGYDSVSITEVLGSQAFGVWDRFTGGVSYRRYCAESRAFGALVDRESANLVVASVGQPGRHLGAAGAGESGIYLLHTYPHGTRSRLLRPVKADMLPPSVAPVTVSRFAASAIEVAWHLPSGRVGCLHSTAGPILESMPPKPALGCKVVTLGHVDQHKDPETWIKVAERVVREHPSVLFVWAGEGPLIEACRREVAKRGLSTNVRFPGLVANVDQLLSGASIYLQPSRVESLGLGALDAARRGIPSVVSAVGGLSEIVQDGEGGFLLRPGNASGFATAIMKLLDDPELAHRLGRRAQADYASKFSPELWHATLTEMHEVALSARTGRL